jgi:hypothetical protein
MALRWTAATVLEVVKQFRRLNGHEDMLKLVAWLRARDNNSASSSQRRNAA